MKKKVIRILKYIFLLMMVFISVFPFYWMTVGSTQSNSEIFSTPPILTYGSQLLENYANLSNSFDVPQVLFNSLLVSFVGLILSIIINTIAGYAFSKFNFKGKSLLLTMLLATTMIPMFVRIIPLFRMTAKFGALNTYSALIFPQLVNIFVIFFLKSNFDQIPDDMLESARLDGAGELLTFTKVVLPNMKPTLSAAAIIIFMGSWNDFLWPLVATSSVSKYIFPVALSSMRGTTYTDFGALMLGLTISTIPIVIFFLIFQRGFIQGSIGSSVKQ